MRINGAELVVEAFGPIDGPAMIVHHGAPGLGSRQEPKRSFGPFADRMRVIVFDARGSGESSDDGPFTHEQWVADVDAIRAHFGYETIVMAGGSYGGFIAMEYAIAHPDRVSALVLRDTAADTAHDHLAVERARNTDRSVIPEWVIERIGTGRFESNEQLREYWRAILPLYDHQHDPAKDEARLAATRFHYRTHNAAFGQNMPRYDLKPKLPSITCPTLVTVGRHDWRTPVAASQVIADLVPRGELVVFESSGHSPQLEEPERFQQVVRDFLSRAGVLR
ncbi:alpha/beta hydrolase [Micromonospora sp. ANENR4]|uniref:alpha/beta fold hydrolase n=1 Tax=unclassified Micromonospora TaxID=2617518 RepID=UPI00188FB65C|nr:MULTISPECIES: alpha/beta hydrolase [unclassified Micromonospora]MBF5028826.1 alpha/beta hydrolase [Micromonospora sp. ANENR4]MCZ7476045.1 alpha/beta hydrolase [Micromonospora sp. WMMC273]